MNWICWNHFVEVSNWHTSWWQRSCMTIQGCWRALQDHFGIGTPIKSKSANHRRMLWNILKQWHLSGWKINMCKTPLPSWVNLKFFVGVNIVELFMSRRRFAVWFFIWSVYVYGPIRNIHILLNAIHCSFQRILKKEVRLLFKWRETTNVYWISNIGLSNLLCLLFTLMWSCFTNTFSLFWQCHADFWWMHFGILDIL